ncbi:LOW QUALITY PROTEIN: uncharacterized protein LOC142419717 [Mycteria americana]|uniref:LOW QUALITY PROTEIN: uncharacterized protein LOC142419717 n=1 Tax=Mycteria americana TaxID=33587 RepID=UPI003F580CE7
MLFWHGQPGHYWSSPGVLHPISGPGLLRDPPVLPHLKQEEPHGSSPRSPPARLSLCPPPPSPTVRHHEETLSPLRQGQSHEIRMMGNPRGEAGGEGRGVLRSAVRVRGLPRPAVQRWEQQQPERWRWSRPGDRILDIDIPLSVGILEPQTHPTLLNTAEFLWDPPRRTPVFVQVHCISTEFTLRKNGGEKGVPVCIQMDTFGAGGKGDPPEHLHCASCLIKVFKPKGADRKQKTDREKVQKQPAPEREKFQPAYESTVLAECAPWPDALAAPHSPPRTPGLPSPHPFKLLSPERVRASPARAAESPAESPAEALSPRASPLQPQQWLHQRRFSACARLFATFAGADLLELSRGDPTRICGAPDGSRLRNALPGRCPRPRLALRVWREPTGGGAEGAEGASPGLGREGRLEEPAAAALAGKLAELLGLPAGRIQRVSRRGPPGSRILVSDVVRTGGGAPGPGRIPQPSRPPGAPSLRPARLSPRGCPSLRRDGGLGSGAGRPRPAPPRPAPPGPAPLTAPRSRSGASRPRRAAWRPSAEVARWPRAGRGGQGTVAPAEPPLWAAQGPEGFRLERRWGPALERIAPGREIARRRRRRSEPCGDGEASPRLAPAPRRRPREPVLRAPFALPPSLPGRAEPWCGGARGRGPARLPALPPSLPPRAAGGRVPAAAASPAPRPCWVRKDGASRPRARPRPGGARRGAGEGARGCGGLSPTPSPSPEPRPVRPLLARRAEPAAEARRGRPSGGSDRRGKGRVWEKQGGSRAPQGGRTGTERSRRTRARGREDTGATQLGRPPAGAQIGVLAPPERGDGSEHGGRYRHGPVEPLPHGGPRPRQPPRQPPGPALAGPSSERGKELADENSEGWGFAQRRGIIPFQQTPRQEPGPVASGENQGQGKASISSSLQKPPNPHARRAGQPVSASCGTESTDRRLRQGQRSSALPSRPSPRHSQSRGAVPGGRGPEQGSPVMGSCAETSPLYGSPGDSRHGGCRALGQAARKGPGGASPGGSEGPGRQGPGCPSTG